jgi:signal peptidase I
MRQLARVFSLAWRTPACRRIGAALIAAGIGIGLGKTFLGKICVVTGSSMAPNFAPGDWVHARPIAEPLQRADVVVLDDGNDGDAIKRIVGLPGETVQLWHGYVFINNRILLEPYLPKWVYTFPRQRQSVFLLGPDQYFVLGDNRPKSADSRQYGPVDRRQLKTRIPLPAGAERARFGPMYVNSVHNS